MAPISAGVATHDQGCANTISGFSLSISQSLPSSAWEAIVDIPTNIYLYDIKPSSRAATPQPHPANEEDEEDEMNVI